MSIFNVNIFIKNKAFITQQVIFLFVRNLGRLIEKHIYIYIYNIYIYIKHVYIHTKTKKTFIIFISLYFRILPDSFIRLIENLKLFNYMELKGIA